MNQYKKLCMILVFTIYIAYLVLRILSVPTKYGFFSFFLGTILLISEIMGFLSYCMYIMIFNDKSKQKTKEFEELKGKIPTVDVLICAYNEEISLLEKTILAATRIKYPKDKIKVYVLDDGKNKELENLCHFYKVNYITRESNKFAKAGNINNALNKIEGEYFLVLDADMIPYKDILQRTMGYFKNKNLAFIQTPQTFYNPDIYQFNINKNFNNEQDFFMRYIEPARASNNAVIHIGTNAIFKREYVIKVGGYPTCSITEDIALGLLLQAEGYDSLYINEKLASGLSATTYRDLVKQRDRWCRGNLQVMHNFKHVIFKKLKFKQKIIYLDGIISWFSGITKSIFLIMPMFGLLGIPILDKYATILLILFAISFVGQFTLSKIVLPKKISKEYLKIFFMGNVYNTVMAPHLTGSVIKNYFFSDSKFNVTDKKNINEKAYYDFKLALPHIILVVFFIVSIFIGTFALTNGKLSIQTFILNLFWLSFNLPGLIYSLKIAYQPIRKELDSGINIEENINVLIRNKQNEKKGTLKKIGGKEILIELKEKNKFEFNPKEEIKVCVKGKWINAKIKNQQEKFIELKINDDNKKHNKVITEIFLDNLNQYNKNLDVDKLKN